MGNFKNLQGNGNSKNMSTLLVILLTLAVLAIALFLIFGLEGLSLSFSSLPQAQINTLILEAFVSGISAI